MHERPSTVAAEVKRTSKHTLISHIFGKQFNVEMLCASLNIKTTVCSATVFIFLLKGTAPLGAQSRIAKLMTVFEQVVQLPLGSQALNSQHWLSQCCCVGCLFDRSTEPKCRVFSQHLNVFTLHIKIGIEKVF